MKTKPQLPQKLEVNDDTIKNLQVICDETNKDFVEIGKKLSAIANINTSKLHHKNFLAAANFICRSATYRQV